MKRNYKHKVEYIGCDCSSLSHVICFSYYPPEEGETPDPEDEMIYLTILSDSWRNGIWPFFWDKEWELLKEHFTISHWKDFFYYSIWARLSIGLKYVFKGSTESMIYGGTAIAEDDLDKLYGICSWLSNEEKVPEKPISITVGLSDETFFLTFGLEFHDGEFMSLDTEVYFTKANFFRRLKRGVKYFFGRYNNMELCFSIDAENASLIKGFIRQIQQGIEEFDAKNNSNKSDS